MTRGLKSQFPSLPGYNPDNLQVWLLGTILATTVMATIALALRLISRRIRQQKLWWDDWMIVFSICWYYLVLVLSLGLFFSGVGIHADLLPHSKVVATARWLLVCEILYVWNLAWTKLGVLLMYYRIFSISHFRKTALCIAGLVMAWAVTITITFICICVPIQKLWYPEVAGHCINQTGTWLANAISTIITDLTILIMPMPHIWRLQLRTVEKMGLTVVLGLGFFVVFASVYRTTVIFTYNSNDSTYTLAPIMGWTGIEMAAGITSACLPTLLPVLRLFAQKIGISGRLFSSQASSRHAGASNRAGGKDSNVEPGNDSTNNNNNNNDTIITVGGQPARRPSSNQWYRLSDGEESDGTLPENVELEPVQSSHLIPSGASESQSTPESVEIRTHPGHHTSGDVSPACSPRRSARA